MAAAVGTDCDQTENRHEIDPGGDVDEPPESSRVAAERQYHADAAEHEQRQCGEAVGRGQLRNPCDPIRRQAPASRGGHDFLRASGHRMARGSETELEEHEHREGGDGPRDGSRSGAGPRARPRSLDERKRGRRRDPDPGLGRAEAGKCREQGGKPHPPAHGRQCGTRQQRGQQRFDDRGPGCEQEHRVEDEQRDRDPCLARVGSERVDARGGGHAQHGA